MLAKLIVHGADRAAAIAALRAALDRTRLAESRPTWTICAQFAACRCSRRGDVSTRGLMRFDYRPRSDRGADPGHATRPSRTIRAASAIWDVGVPPSGPMDDRCRFGWGTASSAIRRARPVSRCTLSGPTLRFHRDTIIASPARRPRRRSTGDAVPGGSRSPCGGTDARDRPRTDAGCRSLSRRSRRLRVPPYIGSRVDLHVGPVRRSWRPHAAAGRHAAPRRRSAADANPRDSPAGTDPAYHARLGARRALWPAWRAGLFHRRRHRHFFGSTWTVHYNSQPHWRAADRAEAAPGRAATAARRGSTPRISTTTSTPIGAVDFTGDMPIILTRDGPSLGGFVCPVTIAKAELVEGWSGEARRPHPIQADQLR